MSGSRGFNGIPLVRSAAIALLLMLAVLALTRGTSTPIAWEMESAPMDLEVVGAQAYATLGGGEVIRFALPLSAEPSHEVLIEGLPFPRGLAVLGDRLYVAVLGESVCGSPYPYCYGAEHGDNPADGEAKIITSSRGQVWSYALDGSDAQLILDNVPWADSEHALNDLDVGPDGALYLSVGGVVNLYDDPLPEHPNGEWLGTILRIEEGEVSVHARGLRNVYGLAFADNKLYGVDNDGQTRGGWRAEELLSIEPDRHYGYPEDGSFGPFEVRDGFALGPVYAQGSAGLASSGDDLWVGACGRILKVSMRGGEYHRPTGGDVRTFDNDTCVTALAPLPDGTLLTAAYGPNEIYVTAP